MSQVNYHSITSLLCIYNRHIKIFIPMMFEISVYTKISCHLRDVPTKSTKYVNILTTAAIYLDRRTKSILSFKNLKKKYQIILSALLEYFNISITCLSQ